MSFWGDRQLKMSVQQSSYSHVLGLFTQPFLCSDDKLPQLLRQVSAEINRLEALWQVDGWTLTLVCLQVCSVKLGTSPRTRETLPPKKRRGMGGWGGCRGWSGGRSFSRIFAHFQLSMCAHIFFIFSHSCGISLWEYYSPTRTKCNCKTAPDLVQASSSVLHFTFTMKVGRVHSQEWREHKRRLLENICIAQFQSRSILSCTFLF